MKSQAKCWIIIPAAGSGARFSQDIPKQYWQVAGKTLLEHGVDLFIDEDWVEKIVVALDPNDVLFQLIPDLQHPKINTVSGGDERWHSVRNGLLFLQNKARDHDWVLVHDAARACLDTRDLRHLMDDLYSHPVGGILAAPVPDTIKRSSSHQEILQTVDRSPLWQALTPQMFRYKLLLDALEHVKTAGIHITDDAHAIELCGYRPKLVKAQFPNPKLTVASDLPYFTYLLSQKQGQPC